jgi:uncharacterized protein with ParB-like and HNH nuclease domain
MSRIMPKRLFIGSAGNVTIKTFLSKHFARRKLVAGEQYLGWFIIPNFQRKLVWTIEQKIRLIESIYMGMPIGSLVHNLTVQENSCDGWLLDGHQRTDAILAYERGDYAVHGWRFLDLPEIEQNHFLRVSIPIIQTNIFDEVTCRDVYDRLVYGGTSHDGDS